jgi:hypothetical protein
MVGFIRVPNETRSRTNLAEVGNAWAASGVALVWGPDYRTTHTARMRDSARSTLRATQRNHTTFSQPSDSL